MLKITSLLKKASLQSVLPQMLPVKGNGVFTFVISGLDMFFRGVLPLVPLSSIIALYIYPCSLYVLTLRARVNTKNREILETRGKRGNMGNSRNLRLTPLLGDFQGCADG